MLTATPSTFTTNHKSQLATLLGAWAIIPEEEGYGADSHCRLAYTGTEPLRQGARLFLAADRYGHKGMLQCTGHAHTWDGTEHHYVGNFLSREDKAGLSIEINISLSKSVEQMARDLQRRLIPAYLASYELGMQALREAKTRQAQKQAMAEALCALLPDGKLRGGTRLGEEITIWAKGPTWRVSSDVRVEHLSMTFAQASMLAELITSAGWTHAATL